MNNADIAVGIGVSGFLMFVVFGIFWGLTPDEFITKFIKNKKESFMRFVRLILGLSIGAGMLWLSNYGALTAEGSGFLGLGGFIIVLGTMTLDFAQWYNTKQ